MNGGENVSRPTTNREVLKGYARLLGAVRDAALRAEQLYHDGAYRADLRTEPIDKEDFRDVISPWEYWCMCVDDMSGVLAILDGENMQRGSVTIGGEIYDGPEYEVDPEAEVTVDWDKAEAMEVVHA